MTRDKIVVFGSLNVDLVLATPAHPRPGETVLCPSSALSPGGKGSNQAVAAARAGATVALVGCVGEDVFGSFLLERVAARGVDCTRVRRATGVMTGCAAVAVDRHGENVIYVAPGANGAARADDVPDELLGTAAVVLCQMEVPPSENWRLLDRAKRAGARTMLNVAPARDIDAQAIAAMRESVDVLIVNREEAAQLAAHLHGDIAGDEPGHLARYLAGMLKTSCVLTRGADGASASDGTEVWAVASLPVAVRDTTGAGDTFTGVLAAMLAEGRPMPDALRFASVAASLSCRTLGAQDSAPSRGEIEAHVEALAQVPS